MTIFYVQKSYLNLFTIGKNDDVVKLYDLTSLCSESLVEGRCEGQNPFTVPVAMLLYRVARNLKHNPDIGIPSSPITIQMLLNNCLKLLNKTKYPQVINNNLKSS